MRVRYDMVACHVVRPDAAGTSHEFLQIRRAAGDYMGGTWQIVRGQMEDGETAWQAALRELREETALAPAEFYKLSTLETFYLIHCETIWHCPTFCALIGRDAEVTLNEEHDAARWVPRDQVMAHFMWPGEHQALAELCREILDGGLSKAYLRVPLERR